MHAIKALLLLYLIDRTTANTTTARRAHREAVAACRNLTSSVSDDGTTTFNQFPNPSCWDTLSMTKWMTYWNTSTTICTAKPKVYTQCQCRIDEPWATCFMRLTYERNKTAGYVCTDLTKPRACTVPVPVNVAPGPAEIFYGAYSIWALFNYLKVWQTSLTSSTSLSAIKIELSRTKTSALSANHLLAALVQDYAIDTSLGQAFVSIITTEPILSKSDALARPTLSNAQELLGQLLQQVLDVLTSDWACGDFQAMASGGLLLNATVETTTMLDARLGQQERKLKG